MDLEKLRAYVDEHVVKDEETQHWYWPKQNGEYKKAKDDMFCCGERHAVRIFVYMAHNGVTEPPK
jgi:hypothetical protein